MLNMTQKAILDRKNALNKVGRVWWANTQKDRDAAANGTFQAPAMAPIRKTLGEVAERVTAIKGRLSAQDLHTLRLRWFQANVAEKAGNVILAECHLTELDWLTGAAEKNEFLVRVPF